MNAIASTPLFAVAFSTADTWMLIAIIALLLASVVLAVAETSLTNISKVKAQALLDEGRPGAERLVTVVGDLEHYLNGVLLVVLIFQLVQATLVGVVAERTFGPVGVALATFVNVVVVFVIAEAAPKTWTLQHPERAGIMAAPVVVAIGGFPPVRIAARSLIGLTNVILPGKGLQKGPWVSEEELLAMADAAVEGAVLEGDERDLIESIIDFGDTVAREIMVPRTDMVAMEEHFKVRDVVEMLILNGLSRLPVYRGSIDDIVGIVYAKDLMRSERDGGGDRLVSELMRTPVFVPETKRVAELLREMQATKTHISIVVDEYGGTAGLVTMEDLLEELVGEIHDEFDTESPEFRRIDEQTVIVFDPSVNVDDLNGDLDLDLPEDGDWDSVGGLVFSLLGHAPRVGDRVEVNGYRLIVEKVDGRRVAKLRIHLLGLPPDGVDAASASTRDVSA